MLEKAIRTAVYFHSGQLDKIGQPYILHPLRVMNRMSTDDERIVAVLHDVLEDTDCRVIDLFNDGFPDYIIKAINYLTRREDETYANYIDRVKRNQLATKVKIVDLMDNLSRIYNLPEKERESIRKRYTEAYRKLAIKHNYESVTPKTAPTETIDHIKSIAEKGIDNNVNIIWPEVNKQLANRPSWDDFFIGIAKQVAMRSNCSRRKFGSVLVRNHTVVSVGYNGTPIGTLNCIEGGCPRCAGKTPPNEGYDRCTCTHSECNAILLAARNGNCTNDTTLYIGTRPCLSCLKELIQAGVKEIVFEEDYEYDVVVEEAYQRLVKESGIIMRKPNQDIGHESVKVMEDFSKPNDLWGTYFGTFTNPRTDVSNCENKP